MAGRLIDSVSASTTRTVGGWPGPCTTEYQLPSTDPIQLHLDELAMRLIINDKTITMQRSPCL